MKTNKIMIMFCLLNIFCVLNASAFVQAKKKALLLSEKVALRQSSIDKDTLRIAMGDHRVALTISQNGKSLFKEGDLGIQLKAKPFTIKTEGDNDWLSFAFFEDIKNIEEIEKVSPVALSGGMFMGAGDGKSLSVYNQMETEIPNASYFISAAEESPKEAAKIEKKLVQIFGKLPILISSLGEGLPHPAPSSYEMKIEQVNDSKDQKKLFPKNKQLFLVVFLQSPLKTPLDKIGGYSFVTHIVIPVRFTK